MPILKTDLDKVSTELSGVCLDALKQVVRDPNTKIIAVTVELIRSARFESAEERNIFLVRIKTNDASMIRGTPKMYKGSYKERIEGFLDQHVRTIMRDAEARVEIEGPNSDSVERFIPLSELIECGQLNARSPIAVTATQFSIPKVLIRGRHLIAPSPAVAKHIASLVQNPEQPVKTILDLFGGTGLAAKVACSLGVPERIVVVEKNLEALEELRLHANDPRIQVFHGDAFNFPIEDPVDLIVADPYYEDALDFLNLRLPAIAKWARVFVFVPGDIADISWNAQVEFLLRRAGFVIKKRADFGQVIFEARIKELTNVPRDESC